MKKALILLFVIVFAAGAALAEGKKGHDCPLAKGDKAAAVKEHDCPHAKAAKGGAQKHDYPGARLNGAKKHDCKGGHGEKGKKCGGMCPAKLKGVEKAVKNVENGVEITFTAKDKETIAKVQEMAAKNSGPKAAGEKDCDCRVEGSETKVANTETGVVMQITGSTPEMISRIQAASTKEHKCGAGEKTRGGKDAAEKKAEAAAKYICPMKCAGSGSDKPGKCPKCGMDLVEQK